MAFSGWRQLADATASARRRQCGARQTSRDFPVPRIGLVARADDAGRSVDCRHDDRTTRHLRRRLARATRAAGGAAGRSHLHAPAEGRARPRTGVRDGLAVLPGRPAARRARRQHGPEGVPVDRRRDAGHRSRRAAALAGGHRLRASHRLRQRLPPRHAAVVAGGGGGHARIRGSCGRRRDAGACGARRAARGEAAGVAGAPDRGDRGTGRGGRTRTRRSCGSRSTRPTTRGHWPRSRSVRSSSRTGR